MLRLTGSIAIVTLLTACGAMPSKVSLPKHLDETNVDPNGRPSVDGNPRKQYDDVASDMGIQPVATSRKAVLYQINLLIGDWNAKASTLLGERDVADNATFWGTAIAAGLVMSNEMKAAKYVAGSVAGVKIIEDNYKTVIQASNYSTAAEAAECIRTQVLEVNQTAWDKYFNADGSVKGTDDPVQLAALSQTFSQINGALSAVYKKLRSNQRSVRVTAPTADSISKAIADTQAQAGIVNNTAERSAPLSNGIRTFVNTHGVRDEFDLLQLKQLLAVGGKAQTCATAMGS